MSHPTTLSPWFVVQRLVFTGLDIPAYVEYYTSLENTTAAFTQKKDDAMLFMSLASAARVAQGEVAEVRALTTEEDAKEFGRA